VSIVNVLRGQTKLEKTGEDSGSKEYAAMVWKEKKERVEGGTSFIQVVAAIPSNNKTRNYRPKIKTPPAHGDLDSSSWPELQERFRDVKRGKNTPSRYWIKQRAGVL